MEELVGYQNGKKGKGMLQVLGQMDELLLYLNTGDDVCCKQNIHPGSVKGTQMPLTKRISRVQQRSTRHVANCQRYIPGCTGEPDLPGTGLDKGISAFAHLENGYCHSFGRKRWTS